MNNCKILTAVKGHLLIAGVVKPVHLTLPTETIYPFVLIKIDEICSSYFLRARCMQRHIRFKVSVYYLMHNKLEAESFSQNIIRYLDGVDLWFPKIKSANIQLLSCASETTIGEKQAMVIHQLYDATITSV